MTKRIVLLAIAIALLFTNLAICQPKEKTDLYIFYGQGCPHCAHALSFFDGASVTYPYLNIIKKEIYFNTSNREMFFSFLERYAIDNNGVPTMFIGDQGYIGFNTEIGENILEYAERCIVEGCADPLTYENEKTNISVEPEENTQPNYYNYVTWGIIGMLSCIIPLIFLSKNRREKR